MSGDLKIIEELAREIGAEIEIRQAVLLDGIKPRRVR